MFNSLLVGLNSGVAGWDHGAAGGALENLMKLKGLRGQHRFSPLMQGWILASLWASTIIGNLTGLYVGSPRQALILASALEVAGSLLTGIAPTLPVLIAGRLLNGLGIGLTGVSVGQYTSEVAPAGVRGGAIACQETNFVLGALVGAFASEHWIKQQDGWRRIWGLGSVGATLALLAMWRVPETPRTIYRRATLEAAAVAGQDAGVAAAAEEALLILERARQQALQSMCSMRGLTQPDEALMQEMEGIERYYASELVALSSDRSRWGSASSPATGRPDSGQELSVLEILSSPLHRRVLLTGCLACLFPALSGHEALLNYSNQSFQAVGFGMRLGASYTVYLYAVKLVAAVPGFLWLDRYGRRSLLSGGLSGVAMSYQVALMAFLLGGTHVAGGGLLASTVAYQAGVGPVAWIVSTELYPSDMRTKGCTLASVAYSFATALSVQFHPLLLKRGPVACLMTYSITSLVAYGLSRAYIPETKGRSLEQIQEDTFSGRLFDSPTAAGRGLGWFGEEPEPDRAG